VYTIATLVNGANARVDGVGEPDGFVFATYQGGTSTGPVTLSPTNFSFTGGGSLVLSRSGNAVILTYNPTPVPEPAGGMLLAAAVAGVAGFGGRVWRCRRASPRPPDAADPPHVRTD
jgi:hypothetical protein